MTRYPNLDNEKIIAIDIETKDSKLTTRGPGSLRLENDRILGVAVSVPGFSEYYNFSHKTKSNSPTAINIENNKIYIGDILKNNSAKIGANLSYEFAWLTSPQYGFEINGELIDVIAAEFTLNGNLLSYSLDSILRRYEIGQKEDKHTVNKSLELGLFGFTKQEQEQVNTLSVINKENVEKLLGKHLDARKFLWQLDYEDVRDYAIGDVHNLFDVWELQRKKIEKEGIKTAIYNEMQMIRITNEMFQNGSPIDVKKCESLAMQYYADIIRKEQILNAKVGQEFNYNSPKQLKEVYDKLRYPYIHNDPTEKMVEKGITLGNPCFNADALQMYEDDLSKSIVDVRSQKGMIDKFLLKYLDMNINGIIHSNFHSIKKGEQTGGTKTGRLSSSNPNMQNVPARDDKYDVDSSNLYGRDIRSLFVPEHDCLLGSIDLSQIEYRFIAHYAIGPGSAEIKQKYNNDPTTDYHQMVMSMTGFERKIAKNLNFGLAYRMSAKAFSVKFHWDIRKARALVKQYFNMVPFLKHTRDAVERSAVKNGYIKTVIGRKRYFEDPNESYKAFNALIQGSAADHLKAGLVKAWDSGVFDWKNGGVKLHSTVHDENNVSIFPTEESQEAFKELKNCMETALKLEVPVLADAGTGTNWYEAK